MKSVYTLGILLLLATMTAALGCTCGGDDDDDDSDSTWSDDDDTEADDDAYSDPCAHGPVFDFDLYGTPATVPYPNDLYTVPDPDSPTGHRVNIGVDTTRPIAPFAEIEQFDFLIGAVNNLDGFSVAADLYVPVTDEPLESTLPDEVDPGVGDGVVIMVSDPGSPFDGEFAPATAWWKKKSIRLRPFRPLRERTHYVIVATRTLQPKSATCYQASTAMHDVLTQYFHNAPDLAGERYFDDIAHLEAMGLNPHDLLAIGEFTTLAATRDLNNVRMMLDAEATAPELTNWQTFPPSHPVDGVNGFATATLSTPVFQDEHGHWTYDADGDPKILDWEDIEVLFSLPEIDAHPEGQPYPVVLYGHGLGDVKESLSVEALVQKFAQEGLVLAGMDAVCHGDRAPIPGDPVTSLLCYFDFAHPLRFRDNIRETIADYMWFARAVKQLGDIDVIPRETGGDGIPDFDVEHLYYLSISMGSIHGGVFSALEENIDAWVVSSAGAKFTGIALEGPYLGAFVDIAQMLDDMVPGGMHAEDGLWTVGGFAQNILDAADPFTYLTHTVDDPLPGLESHAPQVLQQGGEADATLGGVAGAYYNRAGGWPQLEPYVWDTGIGDYDTCPHEGSGFYQYDTDEHFNLWLTTPMGNAYREQATHFIRSHYETGVAEIIDPLAE